MKLDIKNYKTKYFGTDGFRGEVNVTLTPLNAYKVGRFLGWYYKSSLYGLNEPNYKPKIVIGYDTRCSSFMLKSLLVAGITASGADAYLLGVTTTPSVAYITKSHLFDVGVMITASHNPYYDNGIKIIDRNGEKLDDKTTFYIEQYIDNNFASLNVLDGDLPLAKKEDIGSEIDYKKGKSEYINYLTKLAPEHLKNLRIGLDCANGASYKIAKSVFKNLGVKIYQIGSKPNGINVNENCGSTNIQSLVNLVKQKKLNLGFAFDGDADRCFAVDENGSVVDGDKILFVLALRLKRLNCLNNNVVVTTIMSNSGLEKSLNKFNINCSQTSVGDRFVYEEMKNNGYSLGGEQSGHIILSEYATTGDGLLTAIMLLNEVCEQNKTLSKLASNVTLFPQYVKSVMVKNKEKVCLDKVIISAVNKIERELNKNGRILFRKSGTEPKIRIMIECCDIEKAKNLANNLINLIKERGYMLE